MPNFMDEPTAGLDPSERINIRNYIATVAQKMIVLFATHVVSDIECIAKDVIMIRDGRICKTGTPMELIDGMQGKVGELPCKLEDLEQLQTKYCVGNVYQRREGLRVRIVGMNCRRRLCRSRTVLIWKTCICIMS